MLNNGALLTMIRAIVTAPYLILQSVLTRTIHIFVCLILIYVILHRFGIVKRIVKHLVEREIGRQANGAQITISSIEFDLLKIRTLSSSFTLKELIIHTPHRSAWRWDSPIVARVGIIHVHCNLLSLFKIPTHLSSHITDLNQPIKPVVRDVYSVQARDLQVFVEKRKNIFNFHLLDPTLDLPDPEEVMCSINPMGDCTEGQINKSFTSINSENQDDDTSNASTVVNSNEQNETQASSVAETKANEIVMQILGGVTSLGKAANEGGTEAMSNVLKHQKDGFVSHLKKFQHMVGSENSTNKNHIESLNSDSRNDSRPISRTTMIAKEGIQVIKHVGKVMEKNVQDVKNQVDSLKPPRKKIDWIADENPDLFRVGWATIHDLRVFSKDLILIRGPPSFEDSSGLVKEQKDNDESQSNRRQQINTSGWSKPIRVKEVMITPSEFCPPPHEKNDDNIPEIGQCIEDVWQIILMRALTEMAKCNGGQLLNGVFSDVFAWLRVNRTQANVIKK